MLDSIPQKNGAQAQAAFNRTTPTHSATRPQTGLSDERAIIRTLIEHPQKLASELLDKLEVIDFQQPSHALIIKAAKECRAEKLDTTPANIELTLTAATGESEDRSGLIEAIATLQEIELEEYSEATGKQAKRHADKLADDFEKRVTATETAPAYKLYSLKDLAKIPRPQWLIRGVLVEGIASVLSADSGSFKSFVALDQALCVATGRSWQGRDVKQGAVVYVAAEGFFTMFDRATAWTQFHGVELPENFHIVKAPVNLADARVVTAFQQSIESLKPAFVVLDTLSQCAIGVNENDNAAMADFVRGMMFLGNAIGAHVQVLHHNAKATGTFRGAGAIKANADAHITLDKPEGDETNTVFVRCEKQRGKPFEAFALRGLEVVLPYVDEYGDPITTLVFEECGDVVTAKAEKHANAKRADKTVAALMEAFDAVAREAKDKFGIDGVKVGFWKEKVDEADPPICSEPTFWRHRQALEKKSKQIEECGSHNGSPLYRRSGLTITTLTTLNDSDDSSPANLLSQLSQPFRGDSDDSSGDSSSGESKPAGSELPEMPKAKKAKKKNAKADSEAYKSEEF